MNAPLDALASLAYGFASAFVPVFNAEAFVGVHAAVAPVTAVLMVLTVSLGQTAGKLVLFEGARRGQSVVRGRAASREPRGGPVATKVRTWGVRLMRLLDEPRRGAATVLVSASTGVPPLAAVSIAAGTSAQRRGLFVTCCLIGRTARFAAVAAPFAYALR